jgi:hypothetical protein
MNILWEFIDWVNSVRDVDYLTEGKGHMDHPEDMVILGGLPDYMPLSKALSTIKKAASNPKSITIKFDGYPALVFGSGADGKFSILDKHMFNRGANRPAIHSPQQFAQYEAARGEKGRSGLVDLVAKIWPSLQQSYQGPGWYMGDLMFSDVLQDDNGVYKFRPNPNGILYQVQADSKLGKYLAGKQAGIAVHRYLPPDAQGTEDQVTWLSNLGKLKPAGDVALMPVSMPVTPTLKLNANLQAKAEAAQNSEQTIYNFINNAPQNASAFANMFTVYLNNRIVSGNLSGLYANFMAWAKQRLDGQLAKKTISAKMHQALLEYLKQNSSTVRQLFKNWIDVYNYKMDVVKQINKAAEQSPIKGYLQSGQESQEGFVYGGLKFVDRQGFSAQNLAARQQVAEQTGNKNILVIYPGGFHPFHLGHASVFDHLAKKFPDGEVFVAATDSTTERPFQFDDKKFLANQSGVPSDRFIQVKSPYKANEITANFDPNNTILIFAVSEKDADRFSFAPKKDGSPAYFQKYQEGAGQPMSKHGYIYIVPKIDFKIAGQTIDSASKIRQMYSGGDDETREQIITDLYPLARAPKKIKAILDKVLGGLTEADNPNYFGGSSQSAIPGTPNSLQPQPSPEDIKKYHKEMQDLKRFMGH